VPTIDESFVDASAPNAAAMKNGRALVQKKSFTKLQRTEDGTLLLGTCKGSGAEPYRCSSDFYDANKPVHRCTCPSRQFPCKHSLGLMYAFALGKPFEIVAEIPEEIASKREKVQVRAEKKKERDAQPRKVDTKALAKKLDAQLAGLDLLERLVFDLVRLGMGSTTAKTASRVADQAKQLADAYLPGAQGALLAYTGLFLDPDGHFDADLPATKREAIYSDALDQLVRLHALVKKGRAYLKTRLDDPELRPETDTAIAAWLGHAWQLRELKDEGLVEPDVELVQLSFHAQDDRVRAAHVETGVWMQLGNGRLVHTQNVRPYQAAKFIRADDSFFHVAQVPELCVYPGETNPRVRWEAMTSRPLAADDLAKVRAHAASDVAAAVKDVKNLLKAPLADRHPVVALRYARLGKVGDVAVLEDARGQRLVLTDEGVREEPASAYLIGLLPRALHADQVVVGRMRANLDDKTLRLKPLAIVTEERIVRLTF